MRAGLPRRRRAGPSRPPHGGPGAERGGWRIGAAGCDGSGIRLGCSVGAQLEQLANVSAWRFIAPPSAWPKGMIVNGRGERFCNEEVYGATLGQEIVERQDGRAWLVI